MQTKRIFVLTVGAILGFVGACSSETEQSIAGGKPTVGVGGGTGGSGGGVKLPGVGGAAVDASTGACKSGETHSCFVGDPAKAGIGACTLGTQSCEGATSEFDGHWGACVGAVGPSPESCDDGIDNDCNGTSDCADPACSDGCSPLPTCDLDAGAVPGVSFEPGYEGKLFSKVPHQLGFAIGGIGAWAQTPLLLVTSNDAVSPAANQAIVGVAADGTDKVISNSAQYPTAGAMPQGRRATQLAADPTQPSTSALLADEGAICININNGCTGTFPGNQDGRILRVDLASGAVTTLVDRGILFDPVGIAVSPINGSVLVADRGTWDTPGDGAVFSLSAGALTPLVSGVDPTAIVALSDGSFLYASANPSSLPGIYRLEGTKVTKVADMPLADAGGSLSAVALVRVGNGSGLQGVFLSSSGTYQGKNGQIFELVDKLGKYTLDAFTLVASGEVGFLAGSTTDLYSVVGSIGAPQSIMSVCASLPAG